MPPKEPVRKPPPNYFSRSVQMRLLVLVGMFMLVVILMQEAGDPDNWKWMFPPESAAQNAGSPGQPVAIEGNGVDESDDGEQVPDTRLPPQPARRELPAGTIKTTPVLADITLSDHDPVTRTELDGWNRVLSNLSKADQDDLAAALLAARRGEPLDEETKSTWGELLGRLTEGWSEYLDKALTSLAGESVGLNAEQREQWLGVLQTCRRRWEGEILPGLRALAGDAELTLEQRESLAHFQALLDQRALAFVEDNTVLRPSEKDAWFRLFERLREASPEALQEASTGRVSYQQLFKQPGVYRGRLVTIRGQVRLAYHVQAPSNLVGVDGYYIFWVKPQGGPDSPIVVYSLETPPGFPPIKDKDLDRETTALDEDVTFTGYFFKRWAYRARNGAHTAPLMLARVPQWHRTTGLASSVSGISPLPFVAGAAVVSLVIAVVLTIIVYRRNRGPSSASRLIPEKDPTPTRLHALSKEKHLTPIEATLETLADAERVGDVPPKL